MHPHALSPSRYQADIDHLAGHATNGSTAQPYLPNNGQVDQANVLTLLPH